MIDTPARPNAITITWISRGLLVLALTAFGDWLFYDRIVGLSLALFLIALAATVPLTNTVQTDWRAHGLAFAVLILGLLPLLEDVGVLAVLFGIGGLLGSMVLMTGGLAPGRLATLGAVRRMLVAGPFQIVTDLTAGMSRQLAAGAPRWRWQPIVGWVTPILLGALFALLFAAANPVIDAWLSAVSWSSLQPRISVGRALTWLILAALAWPFVTVRRRYPARTASPEADAPSAVPVGIAAALGLGPAVILRCLVLFNLLFALQSTLDILFLWGGLALPAGVTYAAYAHRGPSSPRAGRPVARAWGSGSSARCCWPMVGRSACCPRITGPRSRSWSRSAPADDGAARIRALGIRGGAERYPAPTRIRASGRVLQARP